LIEPDLLSAAIRKASSTSSSALELLRAEGEGEWEDVALSEYALKEGVVQRMVRKDEWKLIYHWKESFTSEPGLRQHSNDEILEADPVLLVGRAIVTLNADLVVGGCGQLTSL